MRMEEKDSNQTDEFIEEIHCASTGEKGKVIGGVSDSVIFHDYRTVTEHLGLTHSSICFTFFSLIFTSYLYKAPLTVNLLLITFRPTVSVLVKVSICFEGCSSSQHRTVTVSRLIALSTFPEFFVDFPVIQVHNQFSVLL